MASDEKRPVGRPSLYKEAYCNEVIQHCAQGWSLTAFAGEIGVSRECISEWCRVHPEFSVSVKKAKAKCAAWWEGKGRAGVTGDKDVNPTLAIFGLKNMAPDDWADVIKNEHTGKDGDAIKIDQVKLDAESFTNAIAGYVARAGTPSKD
jgi:transposase